MSETPSNPDVTRPASRSPAGEGPGQIRAARRRLSWPRIFGYDFFISFKLGTPPVGAQSYASDLARGLRELDYAVFFSEEEAAPGEELDATLVKALRGSRILIVIANTGALLQSVWVRKEVEQFRKAHPKRSVITINVDRAVERDGPSVDAHTWLGYEGRIWLDESMMAVQEGIVTKAVIERLALAPRFLRANRLFRSAVSAVMLVLIGLASYAWMKNRESHERLVTYNLAQGTEALTSGRALDAAPSLLRALREGADTPEVRFMLARALTSVDALAIAIDGTALAFSPNGDRVAIALADGTVVVRSASDLKVLSSLERKIPTAVALVFSPEGRSLVVTAAAADATGKETPPWETDCPVGVRGNPITVTVWSAESGRLLHEFRSPGQREGCSLAFFANRGATLGVAGWSTQRTDLYWWMTTYDAATFAPLVATGPVDSTNPEDLRTRCGGHPASSEQDGAMECHGRVVGVSTDGALLAIAPWDLPQRELTLWQVQQGAERVLSLGHDTEILSAAFSADNERVAMTLPEGVEVWDVRGQRRLLSVPLEGTAVPTEFSLDGARLLAVTSERGAAVFDAAGGDRLAPIAGHAARLRVARFSPDGERVVTAGDDGLVKLWDSWTGRLLLTLEGHRSAVTAATFSPDLRFVASEDRAGRSKLWHGNPPGMPRTLRDDPARVRWWSDSDFRLVDWSGDGETVLTTMRDTWGSGEERLFARWDVRTGTLSGAWRRADPPVLRHAGAPAATPSDPEERIDTPCPPAAGQATLMTPLALSSSGDVGLSVGRGPTSNVAFVQSKVGGCRKVPLAGHIAEIKAAAFSPDGRHVLTVDEGGSGAMWTAATGERLSVFEGERSPRQVAFLPGERTVILNNRNTAVVWDVSAEQRPPAVLERLLTCSGSFSRQALADLVSDEQCPRPGEVTQPESASAAARAFLVSGWARRHDPVWADSRLREASQRYQETSDLFGAAITALARRAVLRAAGNAVAAEAEAKRMRELVGQLGQAEDQRVRLTRLGEIAFNDFADTESARAIFHAALERAPEDPLALIGNWEASLVPLPSPEKSPGYWSMSQRVLALQWVAAKLAGAESDAFAVWNMYAGTTFDPIYERLDFRGLRREIAAATIPAPVKDDVSAVLAVLELPGNHASALKRLLAVPDTEQTVGP